MDRYVYEPDFGPRYEKYAVMETGQRLALRRELAGQPGREGELADLEFVMAAYRELPTVSTRIF